MLNFYQYFLTMLKYKFPLLDYATVIYHQIINFEFAKIIHIILFKKSTIVKSLPNAQHLGTKKFEITLRFGNPSSVLIDRKLPIPPF